MADKIATRESYGNALAELGAKNHAAFFWHLIPEIEIGANFWLRLEQAI